MFFLKIAGWLLGGKSPLDALTDAYGKYKDSAVKSDQLKADVIEKRIDAHIESEKRMNEVRLATAGFWEMRLFTVLIAFPFVLHANAVGLDTTFELGWGIPAFPSPFDEWEGVILLSFFGVYAGTKAVTALAGAFASRR